MGQLPMPLSDHKIKQQEAVEQARVALEQKLGPKSFLQGYAAVQVKLFTKFYVDLPQLILPYSKRETFPFFKNQIVNENVKEKAKKLEERKSFEVFKKKFPNQDVYVFFELYDLVKAEAKLNE